MRVDSYVYVRRRKSGVLGIQHELRVVLSWLFHSIPTLKTLVFWLPIGTHSFATGKGAHFSTRRWTTMIKAMDDRVEKTRQDRAERDGVRGCRGGCCSSRPLRASCMVGVTSNQ